MTPYLDGIVKQKWIYTVCGVVPWGWITGIYWLLIVQLFGIVGFLTIQWNLHRYGKMLDEQKALLEVWDWYKDTDLTVSHTGRDAIEDLIDVHVAAFNKKFGPGEMPHTPFHILRERLRDAQARTGKDV